MNSSSKTIAKNASVLLASQMTTWVLTFLATIILARNLGASAIGQFQIANSLWAVILIISSFGMDTFLMKEVSRDAGKVKELLGTILTLRLVFFIAGAVGVFGYVRLLGYSLETSLVVYILGVANLLMMVAGAFEACLKGLERMEFSSLASVISIAIIVLLRISLVFLGEGVVVIAAVGILGAATSVLIQFLSLRRINLRGLSINLKSTLWVLKSSLPFLFVYLGIVLYHQVDTLVISWFLKENEVGWYGVPDQIYGTLLFIPTIFFTAIFPALSRTYTHSLDTFRILARKSIDLMMLFSIPIGLGIFVIANRLVVLLFGPEFVKSGPILAVRGIVLILTYLNMLIGYLLMSMDKQKAWAGIILIAMLVTIPLDIILVPWCEKLFANGALGGGLSFLFTEAFMTISGYMMLPKGIFNRANAWYAARAIFAGLVMMGITWLVRNNFIAIPIATGGAIYIGLVFALRLVTQEDRGMINELRSAFVQKVRGRFTETIEMKG